MSTVEAPASHLPLPMQNILSRLAANSTEAEQALVRKAYAYAAAAHAGQVRLSGEPYLSHPLAVAEVLAELGFDAHSGGRRAVARYGRGHESHARRG